MLSYRKEEYRVTIDHNCRSILDTALIVLKEKKVLSRDSNTTIADEPDERYTTLMHHFLEFTEPKLQPWVKRNLPVLQARWKYLAIACVAGIMVYLAIPLLIGWIGVTAQWLNYWSPAVSLAVTVLGATLPKMFQNRRRSRIEQTTKPVS